MIEQKIKMFNSVPEFFDTVFTDDYELENDLTEEEFYDTIYFQMTKVGTLKFDNPKLIEYDIYDVGSTEGGYAINNSETLYEGYKRYDEYRKGER
jgi:hypothetical protein